MKLRRILGTFLAVSLIAMMVGCQNPASETVGKAKTSGSDLEIWYAPSTSKIVQDDEGGAAKTAKENQKMIINMARNEEEGAQLMMYAKNEIPSYSVSVSDLVCNEAVISAEDIDIYQIKYQAIEGRTIGGNPDFLNEMVPDPMLPFEKAVEYKENEIEKGHNQAIFFDVHTSKETASGTYSGIVSVQTQEEEYQMPIQVNVYDVTLPDTAELKVACGPMSVDSFASGELNGTTEMYDTYLKTLHKYEMSGLLPFEGVGGTERYCELLREYYNLPGFTIYKFYYSVETGFFDGERVGADLSQMKQYIKAVAEMSVQDKVNYLDKAIAYFYSDVDEPETEAEFLYAKKSLDNYDKMLTQADQELKQELIGTEGYTYYESVVSETLLKMPYELTGKYSRDELEEYGLQTASEYLLLNLFNTEEIRESYTAGREDMEIAAYLCCEPFYPYPTSHTDDYAVGLRTAPWMCNEYEIDEFDIFNGTNYLIGPSGDVCSDRWLSSFVGETGISPGDGVLFYPGAKYGLDYPCPSIRAMAVRDGVQDYSLINEVRDIYYENGMTADDVLEPIFRGAYNGTVPITDSYEFETTRQALFDVMTDLRSNTGVLFGEKEIHLDYTASVQFVCINEDAEVTVKGKTLKPDQDGFYCIKVDLNKDKTTTFTVSCGKEKKEYLYTYLDGELRIESFEGANNLDDYFYSTTPGYVAELSDAVAVEGIQAVHVKMNDAKETITPYIALMSDSKLIGGSWKGVKEITLHIYNPAEEEVTVNASFYDMQVRNAGKFVLAPGEWTEVVIPMLSDITDVEHIQELDLTFTEGSAVEIYIDGFSIEGE